MDQQIKQFTGQETVKEFEARQKQQVLSAHATELQKLKNQLRQAEDENLQMAAEIKKKDQTLEILIRTREENEAQIQLQTKRLYFQ